MAHKRLSIVIPTFNSFSKMSQSLAALDHVSEKSGTEIIFIDDCSTDGTYESLSSWCENRPQCAVFKLGTNSGSAAAPRNVGIEQAQGEYVYFLDSDDVIDPIAIEEALDVAIKYDYDAVRTSLKVRYGDGREVIADLIPSWASKNDRESRIRAITKHQSLTCSFFMKRSLLVDNSLRFDESLRIGEDITFTAKVLACCKRIGYRAQPSRVYVRSSVGEESVTQKLSSQDFDDFVTSWQIVQDTLVTLGTSFVAEHGLAAIQYALRQTVWFKSETISEASFNKFSQFVNRHYKVIKAFRFAPRYKELISAARNGDYRAFTDALKLRVVVAGHDLKFLAPIIEMMKHDYNVRIDKWNGHKEHSEAESLECVGWGDLIWAEWLLGASVWYSRRVRGDQRLIVRAHRSEMVAEYGCELNLDRLSALVCIAPHTLADFTDRFDIPREKAWLIPNALEVGEYQTGRYSQERLNTFGMVGVVPSLKGYRKGLEVLKTLRDKHPDVKLRVFGKEPQELKWVWDKENEANYFKDCEKFIQENDLERSIQKMGWVDTKTALQDVAAVVSFSDFEGMQVSVAEGFCAGGVGVTTAWRGAEQGYPRKWVVKSAGDVARILEKIITGEWDLETESARGRSLIEELYGVEQVWKQISEMIKSIRA